MAVYGDFQGTGGNLAVDSSLLKRDVLNKLIYKEPELQPLTIFMRHPKLQKATASSFKYEWAESDNMAQFTQINKGAGYSDSDTSFVVDDSSIIGISSILVNQRTNEHFRVSANNTSTNTITVSRSWGGTAAAALLDNDYLTVLSTAAAEGDESQVSQVTNEAWKFNYVQEIRHPFAATWMGQASEVYLGPLLPRRRAERLRDHKMAEEMAHFYNERNTDVTGDERVSTFGGLHEFITTNVHSFGGVVTLDEMITYAEDDFEYGSGKKFGFFGKAAMSNIARVAVDILRGGNVVETMGVKLNMLQLQHGDLALHNHKLFRGNEYTKRGFILDMNNISRVPMRKAGSNGGDTYLRKDLQANSATADKEEWYTAVTQCRKLEDTHAIWDDLA